MNYYTQYKIFREKALAHDIEDRAELEEQIFNKFVEGIKTMKNENEPHNITPKNAEECWNMKCIDCVLCDENDISCRGQW